MESTHDVALSREIEHPYAGQFAEVYDHGTVCSELARAWDAACRLRNRHQDWDDEHPAIRPVARLLDAAGSAYLVGVADYLVAATDIWSVMVTDDITALSPAGWTHWITVPRLREQVTTTPDLPGDTSGSAKTAALQALDTTEERLAHTPPPATRFLDELDHATPYQLGQLASALHTYARQCHQAAYDRAHADQTE